MQLKNSYSSREVAALTGLTARQLQLWDAGGLLSPAIPSHKTSAGGYTERRYTPIELFELLALADLKRRGFTVHQLHSILRVLGDQFEKPSRMRFQRRRAASTWFSGDASEPHKPLHPPHRRTHAHLEPFRRLVPRRTSLDALHQPRPQVQGIAPACFS